MDFKDLDSLIKTLERLFNQSPLLTVVVLVIAAAFAFSAMAKTLDYAASAYRTLRDGLRSAYIALTGGAARKEFLNRRRQFLRVLQSDLASIAKAEAWNDQHFTDLEAEVEVEGGYYDGALDRVLKRRSNGLRKEASLIKAIDKSSEKCLLLTGDPGAGKSVALRHLANQMIERSLRSKNATAPIPLYINLREMNLASDRDVTVDGVKSFVIDNVRRGDADTADYLRENWDSFQKEGVWFFLFDSFDEIPAVMHAAATDAAVADYGRAIRQFMDGLGSCRGVLASREYKSPTNLTWPKLRILALDERLQEELIERTFLARELKVEALKAVSLSESATYRNPLFLTLLCRYLRSNGATPRNEHELLFRHVESLAARDTEYVMSKWGLGPDRLLRAASALAKLFATTRELGLAPTLDEIQAAAHRSGMAVFPEELNNTIEALTYVKIGRTDVQSSDTAVRRFAFGHRRYQECLYATYLMNNLEGADLDDLIVDVSRREYLVALLQIGEGEVVDRITLQGANYLQRRISHLPLRTRRFLGEEVTSFDWEDKELEHVLSVFVDAKRYAPNGPWHLLEQPIEGLLGKLWVRGDYYDRRKILQYCALGSAQSLASRLEFSIHSGIDAVEESAIYACRFLSHPSRSFSVWVRQHVGARIATASRKFDLLRWEVIAAQLPGEYSIAPVVKRAKSVTRVSRCLNAVVEAVERIVRVGFVFARLRGGIELSGHKRLAMQARLLSMQCVYLATIVAIFTMQLGKDGWTQWEWALLVPASVAIVYFTKNAVQLACLHVGVPLTSSLLLGQSLNAVRRSKQFVLLAFVVTVGFLLPGVIVYLALKWADLTGDARPLDVILGGSAAAVILTGAVATVLQGRSDRSSEDHARSTLAGESSIQKALSKAANSHELMALSRLALRRQTATLDLRSAIGYLSVARSLKIKGVHRREPKWFDDCDPADLRSALSNLLRSFEKQVAARADVSG